MLREGHRDFYRFELVTAILRFTTLFHNTPEMVALLLSRRIFCLLENQQPLVLDAMGTAYIVAKGEVQEQRPAPLRHAHVQAFRNRYRYNITDLEPIVPHRSSKPCSFPFPHCFECTVIIQGAS